MIFSLPVKPRAALLPFSILLGMICLGTICGCGGSTSSSGGPIPVNPKTVSADVVVYGATPSGITAAIEAAHLGKQVILLEPGQHVGGMVSSGLGYTDLYTPSVLGGLVQTFFNTVSSIYGAAQSGDNNGTVFEPHVAEQAFNQMLSQQKSLQVVLGAPLSSIAMSGTTISSVLAGNGITYTAKEFVDASYEGDLLAAANVSFTVGRESTTQYNEPIAGVWTPDEMGGLAVDPYVVPGTPSSGLLPHVESITLGAPGSADSSVMAYNYRLCISTDPSNQIPLAAPANYNANEFELLGRYAQAITASGNAVTLSDFLAPEPLPNMKIDLNNSGAFSTDDAAASDAYPNGSAATRQQIATTHQRYEEGLLYFLITDSRIPALVQTTVQSWGLCKDEFTDNGGWPRQLYIREGRRMIGAYVMTQQDVQNETTITDPIGIGGYAFDNHIEHRVAVNGDADNEAGRGSDRGNVPYPIAYGALTPQPSQATNLLVSVTASMSHIALDSMRVEVTYMIMGQAAGAAASLAIDEKASVQTVSYQALASQLTTDGQVLNLP